MDLNGIGELLSKEQMKMVTGGDGYIAGYVSCSYTWKDLETGVILSQNVEHYDVDLGGVLDCRNFCQNNAPDGAYFIWFMTCGMYDIY